MSAYTCARWIAAVDQREETLVGGMLRTPITGKDGGQWSKSRSYVHGDDVLVFWLPQSSKQPGAVAATVAPNTRTWHDRSTILSTDTTRQAHASAPTPPQCPFASEEYLVLKYIHHNRNWNRTVVSIDEVWVAADPRERRDVDGGAAETL